MSVIRWLVMQEVGRRFEFGRHFESHLARPPHFYMHIQTTTSDEHSIVPYIYVTQSPVATVIPRGSWYNTLFLSSVS